METILSLSKKNIHEMKIYSKKSEIFHYKNYMLALKSISDCDSFINFFKLLFSLDNSFIRM